MRLQKHDSARPASITAAFNNTPLTFRVWRDRVVVTASDLGRALEYANKGLTKRVLDEWSDEFIRGHDFDVLEGAELEAFKQLVPLDGTSGVGGRARRVLVIYESGVDMVALKTEKRLGKRLRRFLADEVLPKLRRNEFPASSDHSAVMAEIADLRAELRTELAMVRASQAAAALAGGMLGPERATALLSRIRVLAWAWVAQGRAVTVKAGAAAIRQHLAAVLGYGGTGATWARFPLARQAELEVAVASLEREVQRTKSVACAIANTAHKAKQTSLPWGTN